MVERYIREFLAHHTRNGRPPETRSLEYVRLVHRGQLSAALARQIAGDARHTLDLAGGIGAHIHRTLLAVDVLASLVTEIDPACQLAHKNKVDSLEPLGAQRRRSGKRWMNADRSQIRVHLKRFAEAE